MRKEELMIKLFGSENLKEIVTQNVALYCKTHEHTTAVLKSVVEECIENDLEYDLSYIESVLPHYDSFQVREEIPEGGKFISYNHFFHCYRMEESSGFYQKKSSLVFIPHALCLA